MKFVHRNQRLSGHERWRAVAGPEGRRGNLRAWKRIALVTDIEWMRHMTDLFGWITPGETRTFSLSERDDAKAWVAG